ncbi:hypothetical protein ACXWRW_12160, partial [Streptococcus pyogenes]
IATLTLLTYLPDHLSVLFLLSPPFPSPLSFFFSLLFFPLFSLPSLSPPLFLFPSPFSPLFPSPLFLSSSSPLLSPF